MFYYDRCTPDDLNRLTKFYARHFYAQDKFLTPEHAHRFFLAIDNGVIVGAAGYRPADESTFLGTEIIWTAVDEHYRKRGIAGDLINQILLDTEGDIYVSAWRTMEGGQKAHLDTVLVKRGFKLAQYPYITWESGITCEKEKCLYGKKCQGTCHCFEDTYVLKRQKGICA